MEQKNNRRRRRLHVNGVRFRTGTKQKAVVLKRRRRTFRRKGASLNSAPAAVNKKIRRAAQPPVRRTISKAAVSSVSTKVTKPRRRRWVPTKFTKEEIASWKRFKSKPPVLPIRSGKDEALDSLRAEYEDLKRKHPQWAQRLNLDFSKMSQKELADWADNVEVAARTIGGWNKKIPNAAKSPNAPLYRYAADLVLGCKAYDVPLNVMTSILCKESSGVESAVSYANCVGLMQVHHDYHRDTFCKDLKENGKVNVQSVMHPVTNVFLGCQIFRSSYTGKFDSLKKIESALSLYVGGKRGNPVVEDYIKSNEMHRKRFAKFKRQVQNERSSGKRNHVWQPVKQARSLDGLKEKAASIAETGAQKVNQVFVQSEPVRETVTNALKNTVQIMGPSLSALKHVAQKINDMNAMPKERSSSPVVVAADLPHDKELRKEASTLFGEAVKMAVGKQVGIGKDYAVSAPSLMSAALLAGGFYALARNSKSAALVGAALGSQAAAAKEILEPLPGNATIMANEAQKKAVDRLERQTLKAGQIIIDGLREGKSQEAILKDAQHVVSDAVTSLDRAVRMRENYKENDKFVLRNSDSNGIILDAPPTRVSARDFSNSR